MEELKEITKGKFKFLKEYSNGTFDKSKLREVSTLLRFLFIDNGGSIQQIKNKLNLVEPKIELTKNDFNNIPGTVFYQCGGGNKNGEISIQGRQIINRVLTPEEIKQMYEEGIKLMEEKKFLTIGQYFNTISFSYKGINISYEFLVIFAANKLGGNHYDKSRKHIKENEEKMMLALDEIMNNYKILDENPIFIEIMSISQLLSNDNNLNDFINKL